MTVKTGIAEVLEHGDRHTASLTDAGLGALGTERGNLPLETIEVRSVVVGLAVRTELAQGFRNPHDVPLEATYIFPLPDRAAVTALRMEAGDRVIEGILKEREAARADYDRALSEGKRAAIAEEERPGVFTLRVGNIMPGERIVVRTTLSGRLPYEDGEATYRFPLVVAPRYLPGAALPGAPVGDGTAADTDAVPDASRISPPVLLPGFPNPVQLSVQVDIDPAGLPIDAVRSSLHGVAVTETDGRIAVRLNPGNRADRDFILRVRLGSDDAVTTSLAVAADDATADGGTGQTGDGGTFMLTVLPPTLAAKQARPRDVVIVLDRSGSMDGWKMVAARRAAARVVDTLTAGDRFTVLAFDDRIETAPNLPSGLVEATDRHRFRAVEHLARMDARGGTEMLEPLRQAADLLTAPGSRDRDRVLVLVTDGQVGNEDQVLATLAPQLADVRVHTLGVDRAVNEAFLRRLAQLGGGRYELVESEDRLDEAMAQIHQRIGAPQVTGLRLTGDGLAFDAGSVEPSRLPDLFAGAPVVITGRFSGKAVGALSVAGDGVGGAPWQVTVPAVSVADAGLAAFWARGRIRDLEDRYVVGGGNLAVLEREIVATSLAHSVLCRFTSFVAVDTQVVNESGNVRRITQPVDAPSGWDAFDERSDFSEVLSTRSLRTRPAVPRPGGGIRVIGSSVPAPTPPSASGPPAALAKPSVMRKAEVYLGLAETGSYEAAEDYAYEEVDIPEFLKADSAPVVPARDTAKLRKEMSAPIFHGASPSPLQPEAEDPQDARGLAARLVDELRALPQVPVPAWIARVYQVREQVLELARLLTADGWDAADVAPVTGLAAELGRPGSDPAELERRRVLALEVLEAVVRLLSPSAERPFWKRR